MLTTKAIDEAIEALERATPEERRFLGVDGLLDKLKELKEARSYEKKKHSTGDNR